MPAKRTRAGQAAAGKNLKIKSGEPKLYGFKLTEGKIVIPSGSTKVDPFRVKVAVVTDALGSQAKVAEFLGVARSQPGKWLSGEERPNPQARRRIQDFDYVWDRLTDQRSTDAAHIWLSSPNAFLDGATPLTWLRVRGVEDVIAAIDAEEGGSYA